VGVSTPYVPAFTFSDKERAAQDARLDPIIADLWEAGGDFSVTSWRSDPEFHALTHQRWLDMFQAARTTGDTTVIPNYLDAVLAIARTAAGPFIPIDVWPSVPRPTNLDHRGQVVFQVVANKMREGAGVFTPGKLRRNKHYFLLMAHVLLWPEEIRAGSDIIDLCYPWPFVIVLDEERTPRLQRQEDIRGEGWDIAQRIETTLFEDARQADDLPYGASPTAVERRERVTRARLDAGRVVDRLYDEEQGKPGIIERIRKHRDFEAVWSNPDLQLVGVDDNIRAVRNEYRRAQGLPPVNRGRPPETIMLPNMAGSIFH